MMTPAPQLEAVSVEACSRGAGLMSREIGPSRSRSFARTRSVALMRFRSGLAARETQRPKLILT